MRQLGTFLVVAALVGCATCPHGGRDARFAEAEVIERASSAARVYDVQLNRYHTPQVRYDHGRCTWEVAYNGREGYVGDWFVVTVQDYSGSTTYRAGY